MSIFFEDKRKFKGSFEYKIWIVIIYYNDIVDFWNKVFILGIINKN